MKWLIVVDLLVIALEVLGTVAFVGRQHSWLDPQTALALNCAVLVAGSLVFALGATLRFVHRVRCLAWIIDRAPWYQLCGAGLWLMGHMYAASEYYECTGIAYFACSLTAVLLTLGALSTELLLPSMCGGRRTPDAAASFAPDSSRRILLSLEGPSCMGKTTVADLSLDLSRYIRSTPDFAKKSTSVWLQALYDARLYHDYVAYLLEEASSAESESRNLRQRPMHVCDRSYLSQIVYGILFEHDGHIREPNEFRRAVNTHVFNNLTLSRTIVSVMRDWCALEEKILGAKCDIKRVILVPANYSSLQRSILVRGEFDASFSVLRYLQNQAYLFEQLHSLARQHGLDCKFERWVVDRVDSTTVHRMARNSATEI